MKHSIRRILVHKDSVLLFFVLVWAWFTTSLTVDQMARFEHLSSQIGVIEDVQYVIKQVRTKPLYKDTTCEIQLKVSTSAKVYSIRARCSNEPLLGEIAIGDKVTLYTMSRLFGIFGMADEFYIRHLTKGGDVLVDFAGVQKSNRYLNILTGAATVMFLIWYISKVRHRLYWHSD